MINVCVGSQFRVFSRNQASLEISYNRKVLEEGIGDAYDGNKNNFRSKMFSRNAKRSEHILQSCKKKHCGL